MKPKSSTLAFFSGVTLLTACVPATVVVAADYLSLQSAQHAAFAQADRFEVVDLNLNASQQQAILQLAGPQSRHGTLQVFRAWQGAQSLGYMFVDEVLGRQDLITYAVSIDNSGRLGEVEILSYRESHGGEVRNSAWRKQFAGRNHLSQLRFVTDIKNIAGATLSCEHVTAGVRWVYALWQSVLQPHPAL